MPKKALFAEEKFYRKARFWRFAIGLGFLLLFAIAFWQEIYPLLSIGWQIISGSPEPILEEGWSARDIVVLMVNVVIAAGSFILALLLVSQFVLPVITGPERRAVFSRLRSYIAGTHGPAVFIKEAKEKAREEELKRSGPGVAFVDLCSAVALEKNWIPTQNRNQLPGIVEKIRKALFGPGGSNVTTEGPVPPVRVEGPGIVFTTWGERIRGVADLRRQLRMNPSVSVATRDGFEIRAPVWVLFTLGEQLEEFYATHVGGLEAEHIRAVHIDEATHMVEGFEDEFDELDKLEIHRYSLAPWDAPTEPRVEGISPYDFFPGRVFSALFSQARNLVDGSIVHWADLPLRVAIEIFRDMLSQVDYNNLYQPQNPDEFPFFDDFLPAFNRAVRNQGALAFRYLSRRDGAPVSIGDVVDGDNITFQPPLRERPTRLQTPKELRQRGIRVISAGFPELTPLHQGVRGQLVEYWKAGWQREANLTEANAAYDALRIHSQARADAQQQMADTLLKIINLPDGSKEILSMRIMQTLESAAADPKTLALLSKDTLSAIKNLRDVLT